MKETLDVDALVWTKLRARSPTHTLTKTPTSHFGEKDQLLLFFFFPFLYFGRIIQSHSGDNGCVFGMALRMGGF